MGQHQSRRSYIEAHMPGQGTSQFVSVAERRQYVATKYLQGAMQSQIARDLGLSQSQISLDLKAIRAEWLKSAIRDFDEAKSIELAKLDAAEQAYWQGWERSCKDREISLTKAVQGDKARNEASVRRERQAGDPRFLDGVLKCIAQRCDILGLSIATEAAKELSSGLAGLLAQAKATNQPFSASTSHNMPEA